MKVKIPDDLKQDIPENRWGKVLSSTPVIMTVIATGLAGLSSSEMTRAQYDRSMAAQMQSKAGDQWSFFQAKRLRASVQRSSTEVISALQAAPPLNATAFAAQLRTLTPVGTAKESLETLLNSPAGALALKSLEAQKLLVDFKPSVSAPEVAALLTRLEEGAPETDLVAQIGSLELELIDAEIANALADMRALDAQTKPLNDAIDKVAGEASRLAGLSAEGRQSLAVSKMLVAASRYDIEAKLNQKVASLYELKVRKENRNAQRHHQRSGRFFYGMLAAQVAVIVATMAMAAKKRNLLWSIAAIAGAISVGVAAYVYLYI